MKHKHTSSCICFAFSAIILIINITFLFPLPSTKTRRSCHISGLILLRLPFIRIRIMRAVFTRLWFFDGDRIVLPQPSEAGPPKWIYFIRSVCCHRCIFHYFPSRRQSILIILPSGSADLFLFIATRTDYFHISTNSILWCISFSQL